MALKKQVKIIEKMINIVIIFANYVVGAAAHG